MTRLRLGALVSFVLFAGFLFVVLRPGARRPGIRVGAEASGPNEDGLVVKVSPLGGARLKAELAELPLPLRAPFLARPSVFRNPLLADEFEVKIENASSNDVEILAYNDDTPFFSGTRIEAYGDGPLVFPPTPQCVNSLKYIISPDLNPIVRLKPGESLSRRGRINIGWLDRFEGFLRPGVYVVRVHCNYYRMPAFKDVNMASAPMVVNLTAADIREWRLLRALTGLFRGDGRAQEEMVRLLDEVLGPLYDAMPSMSFRG